MSGGNFQVFCIEFSANVRCGNRLRLRVEPDQIVPDVSTDVDGHVGIRIIDDIDRHSRVAPKFAADESLSLLEIKRVFLRLFRVPQEDDASVFLLENAVDASSMPFVEGLEAADEDPRAHVRMVDQIFIARQSKALQLSIFGKMRPVELHIRLLMMHGRLPYP